jgi:hypothetical protein
MFQTGPNACNYDISIHRSYPRQQATSTIDMHVFIHVNILHSTLKNIHHPRNNVQSMLLVALKSKSIHDYPVKAKALCVYAYMLTSF